MSLVPPDFDGLYARDADPWRVGTSCYEQRKLGLVLACLLRPRYRLAWDPACGTGHLAARLADRCDEVLATDASPHAVELAATRGRGRDNLRVAGYRLGAAGPPLGDKRPDLVLLSEFLYYLDEGERAAALDLIDLCTARPAELVAVHWRHKPHDAFCGGAEVQREIVTTLRLAGWSVPLHHDDADFVIDTLVVGDGR